MPQHNYLRLPIVATGIEEMYTLRVQLKSLHDQLHAESNEIIIPQQFKSGVDASYSQCFTVAHKIKDDIEKLTKEKNQVLNENEQLLRENECLRKKLAEIGKTSLVSTIECD